MLPYPFKPTLLNPDLEGLFRAIAGAEKTVMTFMAIYCFVSAETVKGRSARIYSHIDACDVDIFP